MMAKIRAPITRIAQGNFHRSGLLSPPRTLDLDSKTSQGKAPSRRVAARRGALTLLAGRATNLEYSSFDSSYDTIRTLLECGCR